ncbi:MAG: outer membrane protein OmpA-like peptidoglycan-associated protein [Granulosicoccus sp.]|jgi:outer membrane protein OmpA-like peptidoglycan-associated protein
MNFKTSIFFSTLVFLIFSIPIFSQTAEGFEQLQNEEFESAIALFEQDLNNKSIKVFANYGLAKIYADSSSSEVNLDQAWEYYLAFNEGYKTLKSKKKDQYKKKFKIKSSKLKNQITVDAIAFAKVENSIESYDHFLTFYKKSKLSYRKEIELIRNQLAFENALESNTSKAFSFFLEKYKKSLRSKSPELLKKGEKIFFEVSMKEHGWNSFENFAKRHHRNPYIRDSGAKKYQIIHGLNDKSKYLDFIDKNPRSLHLKFAKNQLVTQMLKNGNLAEFKWFLISYPEHESSNDLWQKFLATYLAKKGEKNIKEFAKMYPQYPFQDELKKKLNLVLQKEEADNFQKLQNSKDVIALLEFWEKFPASDFSTKIESKITSLIGKNSTIPVLEKYLSLSSNTSKKEELVTHLYTMYSEDLRVSNLQKFQTKYGAIFRDTSKVEKDLALASRFENLKDRTFDIKQNAEFAQFIKDAAPHRAAFQALLKIISDDLKNKNWTNAKLTMKKYQSYFEKSNLYHQLFDALNAPSQNVRLTRLDAINSEGSEYAPVISADGKTLYFCAKFRNDNLGKEDIFISRKENNQWTPAKLMPSINTVSASEAPEAISVDGTQMMMFQSGQLCFSNQTYDGWSELEFLPRSVNATMWQADATLSSDGKALLYASSRKDIVGFTKENNLDIYVALKNEVGKWQDVINLGQQINTPFLDRSPFLHPDMQTLYFSSTGHGGFGQMDVFKTTRLDDTWTNWSTPVNLGREINTPNNDWGYKVSTDGATAYFSFSSETSQNEDIYQVELPEKMRPLAVSTISGTLSDSYGLPIDAEIIIEDLETGKIVSELKSNPKTGEFFVVLPDNRKYSYYIKKENYFPISNNIDLSNHKRVEINENLKLFTIAELTEKGVNLTLENIFFDTNKAVLKKESHAELNRVFTFIKTNNFKIELFGHTDNVGENKYNLQLSQKRADAVRKYFIAKGIPAADISALGQGETKPIESNDSEKGKAKNRRVEVKFKN